MAQYVVIGNGVAAVGCIEGIRKEDAAGKINRNFRRTASCILPPTNLLLFGRQNESGENGIS